jgi:hypothetical protein
MAAEIGVTDERDPAVVTLHRATGELVRAGHVALEPGLREIEPSARRGGSIRVGDGDGEQTGDERGDNDEPPNTPHRLWIRRPARPRLPRVGG